MLTDEQKKAAYNFTDNILLLARAGSGKTFTVAQKISEALKRGYSPESILCVTFTVKAAEEIKNAVEKYSGGVSVDVFTIHGFCYRIIKEFARQTKSIKEPTIADEIDAGEMFYSLLVEAKERGDYDFDEEEPLLSERAYSKILSAVKHERDRLGYDFFTSGGYQEAIDELMGKEEFKELFSAKKHGVKLTDYKLIDLFKRKGGRYLEEYDRTLRFSDLMDFDDLIFCGKAILDRTDIFADRYKLIIVDEMQDTSLNEYSVMRRLFKNALVMLCGDEYQTIYGWRGSSPKEITQDFIENFSATTVTLNSNRRSAPYLAYCGEYYLKKAFSYDFPIEKAVNSSGEKIEIYSCDGYNQEAEKVYSLLREFKGEKSDICVMARSNRYIADIYKKLENINLRFKKEERLKFFTAQGDYQFYKKPIIKDFLAFFRLLSGPDDLPSFERVAVGYGHVKRSFITSVKNMSVAGVSEGSFLSDDTHKFGDNYHSLIKAYKENKIVVYDLETTGLDVEKDDFIQISAVKFGEGGKSGEMNLFVLPRAKMSEEAEKVHGYGIEELKSFGAVSALSALEKFKEFSCGCVLVGHNSSSFDDLILKRSAEEFSVRLDVSGYYDTLVIAKLFKGNLKDYKLSTLCEEFSIVNERAHDAFSDVNATVGVLAAFMEKYILPQTAARRSFIADNVSSFSKLYADYKHIGELLDKNDLFGAIRYVGVEMGVLQKYKKEEHRADANEFYLAVKEMAAGKKTGRELMREFVSAAALSGSRLDAMIKKFDKIPIITVHQSKGAEFSEVILVGADENEMPSYAVRRSGNDEEERRVFYVALSRAKEKLIVTYSGVLLSGQNEYERKGSPYLGFLPEEFTEKHKFPQKN